MDELEKKLKEASIEEVRAKTEHLRAQAALWLSQAKALNAETERKK